jgi:hypothetical protein
MKVIKKGERRGGWSGEFACTGEGNQTKGCGAILLVEQHDLFKTTSHARDETTTYVTFRCPECGTLTDIQKDFPPTGRKPVPDEIVKTLKIRNP